MTKFRYSTDGGSTWITKDEALPYSIPSTASQSVIVEPLGATVTSAAAAATYALKFVGVGDSILAGSQAAYSGFDRVSLSGVSLVNLAVPSSTMAQALTDAQGGNLTSQIDGTKPTAILVQRGINDVAANNRTAEAIYYDSLVPLMAIIRSLGGYGVAETILPMRYPAGDSNDAPQSAQRTAYNSMLLNGGDALIDAVVNSAADPVLADASSTATYPDGLHPSTAGQDRKTPLYTNVAKQFGVMAKRAPTVVIYGRPPMATQGTAYSWTVPRAGGSGTLSFAATGLPAGMSIAAATGVISGTPTAAGNVTASITVTDTATGKTWSLNGRTFMVAGAASNTPVASATFSNPTYGAAKFGQGLTGGTGRLPTSVMPASPAFPVTLETWLRTPNPSGFMTPFGIDGVFYTGCGNGNVILQVVNGSSIDNGTNISDAMHHVRVVMTASKTTLTVDGTLCGTAGPVTFNGNPLTIGNYANGFTFVGGIIDDFAVYLTDRTGIAVPTAPVAGNAAGLQGVYPFNGDTTGFK